MLSGCGYHFAGSGDALPTAAQTIYVGRFSNRTRATGLNDEFMRYVLSREGQAQVVRDGKYLPLTADVVREQRKKLEEFAALMGDENSPLHKSFFDKAKEFFG